jgi:uncharacterized protein DUF1573/HYDIN/CFA65/VesB family protein
MNKTKAIFLISKKFQLNICILVTFFISVTLFSLKITGQEKETNTFKTTNSKQPTKIITRPISPKTVRKKAYAVHNFGKVKEGKMPRHSFEFTNTTKKNIKILSTRIPCGCADIAIKEKILPPGNKIIFAVKLNTTKHRGEISKNFYLFTDSQEIPMIKYTLKAIIIPKPGSAYHAPAIVNFEPFPPGESREKKFTIENQGTLDLTINIARTPKAIKIKTTLPMTIAPGKKQDFEFILTSPQTEGSFYKKLVFTTNDKRRNSVLVMIKGEVIK